MDAACVEGRARGRAAAATPCARDFIPPDPQLSAPRLSFFVRDEIECTGRAGPGEGDLAPAVQGHGINRGLGGGEGTPGVMRENAFANSAPITSARLTITTPAAPNTEAGSERPM